LLDLFVFPQRRCRGVFWWLLIAACALRFAALAEAQSGGQNEPGDFDATSLRAPAPLSGSWLVHGGDDPNYAQAGFDDSQWTPFTPDISLKSIFPKTQPEVVWYGCTSR